MDLVDQLQNRIYQIETELSEITKSQSVLQIQHQKLVKESEHISSLLKYYGNTSGTSASNVSSDLVDNPSWHTSTNNTDTSMSVTTVNSESLFEPCIAKFLRDSNEPKHVEEIEHYLNENHILIPGKGNQANIISRLRRDNSFVRVAPGTYGLKEMNIPAMQSKKRKKKSTTRRKA